MARDARTTPMPGAYATTGDLVCDTTLAQLTALNGELIAVSAAKLLSPVTCNQQLIYQGVNYRQHTAEFGMDPGVKIYNMTFTKVSSCIVLAGSSMIKPKRMQFLDYEVELGLVVRQAIYRPIDVTNDNLYEYVAGTVAINDYSARDVQISQMQFYKDKSLRMLGPVGLWFTLLEPCKISVFRNLQFKLVVNDKLWQNNTTANLVCNPAEMLTELSCMHDPGAGDLPTIGTPAGCMLSMLSLTKQKMAVVLPEKVKWEVFLKVRAVRPQYLKSGNVVETRIRSPDGWIDLGTQHNRIIAEE